MSHKTPNLQEEEERLQLAAESAGVGMWMLDIDQGIFWASEGGRRLFGYAPDVEITLNMFLQSVHPEDRSGVSDSIRDAVESGGEILIEYRVIAPDGTIRWIHSRGRTHPATADKPLHMQGASADVTDRKLAEEQAADQLRFETLLTDLSARFVKKSGDDVEQEIQQSIAEVAEFFDCDRCGLLRVNERPPRLAVAFVWYGEGIEQVPDGTDLAEVYPWMFEQLVENGRAVAISSRDDLPPEAEHDRSSMSVLGAKSILVVPLVTSGGVRWTLVASTLRHERRWDPGLTPRLQLLGEVFLNALERKRAEDDLTRSYYEVESLRRQLELENVYLKHEHNLKHGSGRIVGESPAIMGVLELAEQVAPTSSTVFVEGDTGTGKELIAQRIHELSPRRQRPMIKVNCAALPSTLVESEFFGREKGAYTGAVSREPGRFEVANGSTLFLDEISELPLELQAKLLRVLEEGQYERVGSSQTQHTDVRVIAATNRDIQVEIDAGRFRRDLFFRLAVFPIRVPPLRERRDDIPLLVWSAVEEFGNAMNKGVETIRAEDMDRLQGYDWPGNVRELRNVVERAMILCNRPELRIGPPAAQSNHNGESVMSLDGAQRQHIKKALEATGGRISGSGGAAELLGLKPTTLRSKMDRLGINPKRNRDERSSS